MPKILSATLLGGFSAFLLAVPILASHIPQPSGYVNDFAGVLTDDQKNSLEAKLRDYESQTTNEISVAFVKNLAGGEIDDFTVRVFEEWKIGKKDKDNGVLFLAAIEDRKMRIEVGYGLEPELIDSTAGQIIRDIITPKFREGDYYGGTDAGVNAIIQSLEGSYRPPEPSAFESGWDVLVGILSVFGELAIYAALFVLIAPIVYFFSFLARTKSIWLGGVVGSGLGLVIGLLANLFVWAMILLTLVLGGLGLLLDWKLSRNYQKLKAAHKKTDWWSTGGGFLGGGSGGGSFGGFGGGGSGGGGSSGSW